MLRPTCTAKSPVMVPGLESAGLVSPNMTRPVLTALSPSQTMATTGPLAMYFTNPAKKGFLAILEVLNRGLHVLHGDKLEAFVLKALDDLANNATVDAIGLDHDEGALSSHVELEEIVSCRSESSKLKLGCRVEPERGGCAEGPLKVP